MHCLYAAQYPLVLSGGSTAQFGWAWHKPTGELDLRMPVEQADEREVVPLIVGVEVGYP